MFDCYRCQAWPCECTDGITLINGDCKHVMPWLSVQGHSFDLLCTDPPYGIGYDRRAAKESGTQYGKSEAKKRTYEATGWDDAAPDSWVLYLARDLCTHAVIWGGNYFELPRSRGWLYWDKATGANDFSDGELAWSSFDQPLRARQHAWNGMVQEHMGKHKEQRWHPTQKPVPIMRWCFDVAQQQMPELQTSLDPFAGSGTTLVAARDYGCKCIGIELSEKYCQVATDRLAQQLLPWGDDS